MSLGQIIRERRESLGLTQDQVAAASGISKPYLSNIETGRPRNPPSDEVLRALERSLAFEGGELMRLAHLARTPMDVREEHERLAAQVAKLRSVLGSMMSGQSPAPRSDTGGIDLDAIVDPAKPGNVRAISLGVTVPIINKVSAGYPRHFTDLDYPVSVADDYIRCADVHDTQAFACRVVGDSMEPAYVEGDVVIFSPNTPARDGDDCLARLEPDAETTFKRFYQDPGEAIRLQPLNSKYPATIFPREQVTGLWPAVFRYQRVRR